MPRLTYSDRVVHQLDTLRHALPHALLISGLPGVGVTTAARDLAGDHLAAMITPTDADGVQDYTAKGVIRISQIHSLAEMARGKSSKPRVFIVDEASRMNIPAQNAFLKLLEEPATQTHFILATHTTSPLLPTIMSRVQSIHLDEISDMASETILDDLRIHDQMQRHQLLYLAAGRPAELSRLARDAVYFAEQSELMKSARAVLQSTLYESIVALQPYARDRALALNLLTSMLTILARSLAQQPSKEIIDRAERVSVVYDRISANGNVRLQLMTLVI